MLVTQAPTGIIIAADRALPVGLLVNKLVTNALKYVCPSQVNGKVWVNLAETSQGELRLTVVDVMVWACRRIPIFRDLRIVSDCA
jgi:two-component sensor histidine kinase